MSKSLLIGLATAAVLATSAVGAGVAHAWQANNTPGTSGSVQTVGYYGHGYWRPYVGIAPAFVPGCPMRKVWVDTLHGPRLKWRRICRPVL